MNLLHNKNSLTVGNVCINHFKVEKLNVSKSARRSLKRLHENSSSVTIHDDLLDFGAELNVISDSDKNFYKTITTSKRKLSAKKNGIRRKVNNLVKHGFSHERPKCSVCNEYMTPKRKQIKNNDNDDEGYFYVHCNTFKTIN